MIALVVLIFRLTLMCVLLMARLAYWMLKATIMLVTALAASIGAAHASRQRRPVRGGW